MRLKTGAVSVTPAGTGEAVFSTTFRRITCRFQRVSAIRGVLWQSSTPHCTILGSISESPDSGSHQATWINNSGIAVGSTGGDPAIFTPNGIVVDLGNPYIGNGVAFCINNYSQVVGTFFFNWGYNATQAFLYQNGVMTALGYTTVGVYTTVALAINDSGLIVGALGYNPPDAAYYANGAWVDMGFIGYCTSVNASGTIVGTWHNFYQPDSGCFIYQNGQMTHLNAPNRPGNPYINNTGQIVVGNFIYQNGVWQDINDLDLGDGWQFHQAYGINNQGAIIGTVSRVVNGSILYRSALLTPVSPNRHVASLARPDISSQPRCSRTTNLRAVLNAIFYLLRTGCQRDLDLRMSRHPGLREPGSGHRTRNCGRLPKRFNGEIRGSELALTPDENGTGVAVEIALPDRTISTRVKVDPTVAEEEVKVPFVPFPSRCPRIRSWSGCWRDVRISAPMKRCARWRRSRKSFGRPRKVSSYSAITSRRLSPSSSLTYPPLH